MNRDNKTDNKKDKSLIRFDWAAKRILRDKSNFGILEGLLTSLLGRPIKILSILEGEGNKQYSDNKSNKIDLLAQEENGAKILIEVQNEPETSYFHRMVFGTSKVISDYLKEGDNYDKISKIYSINIVYFPLGKGNEFVYVGTTEFHGLKTGELLKLPPHLQVKYGVEEIKDIFPEYYVLRVDDFDIWSKSHLDQWMYFLSNNTIPDDADAPGLKEANEKLRVSSLPIEEQNAYYEYVRAANTWKHEVSDAFEEGEFYGRQKGLEQGLKKGIAEGKWEMAESLFKMNVDLETISKASGITVSELKSKFG